MTSPTDDPGVSLGGTQPGAQMTARLHVDRLAAVLDAVDVPMAVIDADLQVAFTNRAAGWLMAGVEDLLVDAFDLTASEVVGTSVLRFVDDPDALAERLRAATALPWTQCLHVGPRRMELRLDAVRTSEAAVAGFVVTAVVVTDAHEASGDASEASAPVAQLEGVRQHPEFLALQERLMSAELACEDAEAARDDAVTAHLAAAAQVAALQQALDAAKAPEEDRTDPAVQLVDNVPAWEACEPSLARFSDQVCEGTEVPLLYIDKASETVCWANAAARALPGSPVVEGTSLTELFPFDDALQAVRTDSSLLPLCSQVQRGDGVFDVSLFAAGEEGFGVSVKDVESLTRAQKDRLKVDDTLQAEHDALRADVDRVVEAMRKVGEGTLHGLDLTAKRPETAVMGQAFADVVEGWARTMAVLQAALTTAEAAGASLNMAHRAVERGSDQAVTEAGHAVSEMRAVGESVRTVSSSCTEMDASISEIASAAHAAKGAADEAVQAAEQTQAVVGELASASGEIGKVLKVIDSIASQTNLLALNATIEAARAGESGKGFAVVANEVKELAKETRRATGDIERRVLAIQASSERVRGVLDGMSEQIERIQGIQGSVAAAVEEQSVTTREIVRSMAKAADASGRVTDRMEAAHLASTAAREATMQLAEASASIEEAMQGLQLEVVRFDVLASEASG